MKADRDGFYARLESEYATTIRQLVPDYDDMARCILDLVRLQAPETMLEIGVGTGELTATLLDQLKQVRLIGLEPSAAMRERARAAVGRFGDRAVLLGDRVEDFEAPEPFDVVMTNLVLHNVSHDEKPPVLEAIRQWLAPDGMFVWGDFIRYAEPRLQAHFMEYRRAFARDRGCPEDIAAANFEKESRHDFPLTVAETISLARAAGFGRIEPIWHHDCFVVVACWY